MKEILIAIGILSAITSGDLLADPLPSWNDGENKQAIVDFVSSVTDEESEHYVPPAERIATFDNDGCLWSEQPAYFQLFYAIDRVKALAPQHPEWKDTQPFQAVLEGDMEALKEAGEEGLIQLVMASHSGVTSKEFSDSVGDWFATAKHPRFDRPYNELIFQPMLELLEFLRANDFKTFIVSGGGIDFVRVYSEKAYGIPPEQVVGSSLKTKYEVLDGVPALIKLPELNFIDDKEGKPVGIHQHIGRRPIFAAGNSDGDFQMLEYTTAGEGLRFGMIVHHDDADREWAYDRDSHIGRLVRGLDEGPSRGWKIISMKNDWKTIYPEKP
ncbi:MAG: HAD family hydrolase [Verrucomicrobiota bacterium]